MARPTAADLALARIERRCRAGADLRELRLGILDDIRTAVPFDAHVWPLTDPETEVGTAPLAREPMLPELPQLIRLRYLSVVQRWTRVAAAASTHLPDAGHDRWATYLLEHGFEDVATVAFRDRYGLWGWMDLWREGGRPFTARETRWLGELVPKVAAALRAGVAATFLPQASRTSIAGPLVLIVSPDLHVVEATQATREPLTLLVPPPAGHEAIPANAYNVAAQLMAVEQGVDDHPPRVRAHLAHGSWVTISAARLDTAAQPTPSGQPKQPAQSEQPIVVTIESCSSEQRASLFARAHGLSAREGALLRILATGADTREAARALFISEHTVQDHLKSIFDKTSTRTRRALLARAAT